MLEFNGLKGLLDTAQASFFLRPGRAESSHGARNLEWNDQLRARERARADVQRDRGAQAAFPARPPKGREPDRLQEDLQAGGKAGLRRRDRQGLRVRARRVR